MDKKKPLLALALLCAAGLTQAGEKEELLKLRNTTTNLIKQLVKQGILTDKTANEMIKQAEADSDQQVAEAKSAAPKAVAPKELVPSDEVRVSYVPDFVKDEIRQQVRTELREEVVSDVMQKAKKEQWGMPNALPEWIKRFKLSGDIRLRSQNDFMASDNIPNSYFNAQAINEAGGVTAAGVNAFDNTTVDRHMFRERVRLGIDVNIAEGLTAGIRLATGNMFDPVSTNQTLGNTGNRYEFALDRAFLKYDAVDSEQFNWLTVSGGRIKNPWYTGGGEFTGGSELVWDTDLSFEGFAGTIRHQLGTSNAMDLSNGNGPTLFATAGAFPLQEYQLSSDDKWLFGGQMGVDWGFSNQDSVKFGVAYYDYVNTQAIPNTSAIGTCDLNSVDNDASVPQFMQGGNSLATICREGTSLAPGVEAGQLGLATDYNILNINGSYDLAELAPYHIRISGDYAKNLGFNSNSIQSRYGDYWGSVGGDKGKEQTNAWQARVDIGWPRVDKKAHWNVFSLYKYVERDAVLDAFTDSDFHLGGTNAKGWVVGGNYGLWNGVWLTGRWLSADIITGPPFGIDVLQLDINTRF
ncbi:putative porin [Methylobacter sp. S3L5C]|uniref:putative porin n=1 Tax=Methylobacter sp. S3L5C TaxID=2839024 RepID=UPI001FAB98B2|nr:putative porin [Methylobacter sp. S3L5C]UOA10540.1 putative porin [Methylobacter sp. S3L5C]